jgi:hypothetical protein
LPQASLIHAATSQIDQRLVVPHMIHQGAMIDTQVPAAPFQRRAKSGVEWLT